MTIYVENETDFTFPFDTFAIFLFPFIVIPPVNLMPLSAENLYLFLRLLCQIP
jgi:hypothetical protein